MNDTDNPVQSIPPAQFSLIQSSPENHHPNPTNFAPKINLLIIIGVILFIVFVVVKSNVLGARKNLVTTNQSNLVQPTQIPQPLLTPSVPPLTLFADKYIFGENLEQVFNKIAQEYNGQITTRSNAQVWWISDDDFNIINNNEVGLDYQNFGCESDLKSKDIFNDISNKLSIDIKSIMTSANFTLNQKNSSKSIADDQFYDYVQAYEKDNIKCTFTANPDCWAYPNSGPLHYNFSFACTSSFNNNYREQIPYLKGLNITDAIIHVDKRIDNYAKVDVNFRRTGYYAIAQLINGVWTKLYSGQGAPYCKIMEEHQVPQELYENCYPSTTN